MIGLPPRVPEDGSGISGAYLSLIAVSFSELRKDLQLLIESGWAEPVRRRADELASTLAEACDRQRLKDVALLARSLANLSRLSKAKARPVQSALREKFDELLREVQRLLAAQSKRRMG